MGEEVSGAAARQQAIIDMKQAFSGPHGERALAHLRKVFDADKPSFGNGSRTEDAILKDGAKHVLCYIRDMLEADPRQMEVDAP